MPTSKTKYIQTHDAYVHKTNKLHIQIQKIETPNIKTNSLKLSNNSIKISLPFFVINKRGQPSWKSGSSGEAGTSRTARGGTHASKGWPVGGSGCERPLGRGADQVYLCRCHGRTSAYSEWITNVVEIIVHSLLLPLKVSGHLSGHLLVVLLKLSGESMIGSKEAEEAEEDPRAAAWMIGWCWGAGARSLTHILLRRVLLMSTDGSMDRSVERSNLSCFRRRVISIPKGKCRFGTRRWSDVM